MSRRTQYSMNALYHWTNLAWQPQECSVHTLRKQSSGRKYSQNVCLSAKSCLLSRYRYKICSCSVAFSAKWAYTVLHHSENEYVMGGHWHFGFSETLHVHLYRYGWYTGCSLNSVFFSKILKYIPDSVLSRFPLGVSVCTHIRQNWQSSEKSQNFKEKTQCTLFLLDLFH